MSALPHYYHYLLCVLIMTVGLYSMISTQNLLKKLLGLSILQMSIGLFYIGVGKVRGGTAPILAEGIERYSNPLPHVLILTAIVVGVATLAVGLALLVRIHHAYGSIEEDDISASDKLSS